MIFCCVTVLGCSKATDPGSVGQEGPVRETVASLQKALKDRDADKIWKLLEKDSQADAERAAHAIKIAYAKADVKEKSEQEQALGLSGVELAGLTGVGFLKTKRFHGKYEELSESKIDKVALQRNGATVSYTEPDGDKEKLNLVQQDGQWKVSLPMPTPSGH
jgi:hypothetical protein